jgi:hypothetical protein
VQEVQEVRTNQTRRALGFGVKRAKRSAGYPAPRATPGAKPENVKLSLGLGLISARAWSTPRVRQSPRGTHPSRFAEPS